MRLETLEELAGDSGREHVVLRQHFSSSARRLRALVLLAAGLLLALPMAAVIADDPARAHLAEMVISSPLVVAELAFCGFIAAVATGVGLGELVRRDVSQRTVALDPDSVIVEDIVAGRARRWREAMAAYRGVRHRVATTSEGARHVLMLEHDDPARTVHIAFQPYISQAHVVQMADRFGLPVLAPVILSQSSRWSRFLGWASGSNAAKRGARGDVVRA